MPLLLTGVFPPACRVRDHVRKVQGGRAFCRECGGPWEQHSRPLILSRPPAAGVVGMAGLLRPQNSVGSNEPARGIPFGLGD